MTNKLHDNEKISLIKWLSITNEFEPYRSNSYLGRMKTAPIPDKTWDEITYPFLNFNGATVGV